MTVSIGAYNVAEARVDNISLRPLVGAYELVFSIAVSSLVPRDYPGAASMLGARISLRTRGSRVELGFARPDTPFEFTPQRSGLSSSLVLPLQPGQLAAIEDLRGGTDLDFELTATGTGFDEHGRQPVRARWDLHVSRSDWIGKLREADARNILLLEVPIPFDQDGSHTQVEHSLRSAEQHFRNGDYRDCIAACRTAIQELGHQHFHDKSWAGPSLDRLAGSRDQMTKSEREAALWAALRHYTHQAHHAVGEGGTIDYSRGEAQFVLVLTTSFVARSRSG